MGSSRTSYFREGQDVEKGAVLFQIEDRPYRAAYAQALANLARDKETNANAQKEVERYQSLVKQDYVTQEQADQQKATAGASQATVQADEAAVENAKFNLDNTKIRAPIAGRTGGLLVREGNVVHAGGDDAARRDQSGEPDPRALPGAVHRSAAHPEVRRLGAARRHGDARRRAPDRAGYGGRTAGRQLATRRPIRRRASTPRR